MVDNAARRVVASLLEMNVLNVDRIERELRILAARAFHPSVKRWLKSVARNYILNLEGDEAESEFTKYSPKLPKKGVHSDMPAPDALPDWAKRAVGSKADLHFFDVAQPSRRQLWTDLDTIVDWFNTLPDTDPVLNRLDRISFPDARSKAMAWKEDIDKNPWAHIRDNPTVIREYPDGWRWVRMSTEMHLKREGALQNICIGNGGYTSYMNNGSRAYISLRDPSNMPHVTIEATVHNGKFLTVQVKGNSNQKPKAEYQPYIRDLLKQPGWTLRGEAHNVDL